MNLVLYSKLDTDLNLEIQEKIMKHFKKMIKKDNPRVWLVEHTTDKEEKYYKKTLSFYNKLGVNNILRFDLDENYDKSLEDDLFKSDVIHLPGGNTYYFLAMLRKRNMIEKLQSYIKQGGIVVGVSAGTVLLSNTIDSAQFGDENEDGLEDLTALGVIDFEIMPHWNEYDYYLNDLKNYSVKTNGIIYTVEDGEGIVIEDGNINFYGHIGKIENGVYTKI